jgi:2-polyprenyl-3-methyl-5-hydroxy-6-metoxy-1,4-benzoquinol methylase
MAGPEAQLKAFYELRAREEPEIDREAALRFRKAVRAARVSPGDRVLDIGAKWGGFGQGVRSMGLEIDYTGLDLSEENVRKATELGLDVRLADASQPLPADDHEYDCVICLELLEHLPTPIFLLGEIRRVLKPEGGRCSRSRIRTAGSRSTESCFAGPIARGTSTASRLR